jgi:hypothetical protein
VPAKPRAITARQKLELSQLDKSVVQRELMGLGGADLDLEKLVVYLKSTILFDTTDRVIDVQITRSIDGASTVDLTVDDWDHAILRSKAINTHLDIQIDGLWFRLVKTSRSVGDTTLQLTFEQREIALLRTYPKGNAPHNGVKFAHRSHTTRAEFILNLIREVKEVNIPVVIPSLHKVQQIQKSVDSSTTYDWQGLASTNPGLYKSINKDMQASGLADAASGTQKDQKLIPQKYLTVKGVAITNEQMRNANTIIGVGVQMGAPVKVIVCAIMTATTESVMINLTGGNGTSVGLFQQIDTGWGSYSDRHDPPTAARMFYQHTIKNDKEWPNLGYGELCQMTQGSKYPDAYQKWYGESVRTVTAYGIPNAGGKETSAADANNMANNTYGGTEDFVFYRGTPTQNDKVWKREDNWACITRLAEEVGWRAFFISGVFYYLTDDDLYKMQPIATITESTDGVLGIGFDFDVGKYGATVDLQALVGRWLAPPGSVIVLQEMGPLDGRWLVNSFSRSLFNTQADISMSKRQPKLPEPISDGVQTLPSWAQVASPTGNPGVTDPNQAQFGGDPSLLTGSRAAVVAVARKAMAIEQGTGGNKKWHYAYLQSRPYPDTLWSAQAHAGIDCSAFATLCYKEAGCADPNGNDYNGEGYTGTLAKHGSPVVVPQPGDLIIYGNPPDYEHVIVYIGGGIGIGIGGQDGIHTSQWNYRAPYQAFSYLQFSDVPTPGTSAGGQKTLPTGPKTDTYTKAIMVQAGHTIPAGQTDEPYGHEGQTGAVGEQAFTAAVSHAAMQSFLPDTRFNGTNGTAWDASAGATAAASDDIDYNGDLFVSVHYSVGTPGSGFFFGYTRGAADGRSDTLLSGSAKLANSIGSRISAIAGAPPRLGDNQGFGNPSGDPSGASGWGYYAWGSSQRAFPNNVNHVPNAKAAVIVECGLDDNSAWLNAHQADIGRAIYLGICDYYGMTPK